MDTNGQEYLDNGWSLFPTNIGLLTQLHTLQLYTGRHTNVSWISPLTSLHVLRMLLGSSHRNVIQHALLLTNLRCLVVVGLQRNIDKALDFASHKLQALQHLSMIGVRLQLGSDVASLLKLDHLTQISFRSSEVHDENGLFAALVYKLSTLHPQIKLHLRTDLLS